MGCPQTPRAVKKRQGCRIAAADLTIVLTLEESSVLFWLRAGESRAVSFLRSGTVGDPKAKSVHVADARGGGEAKKRAARGSPRSREKPRAAFVPTSSARKSPATE